MRPKILEIEGLQSFRSRQKIDFECLGETGLFGIFGPTGSGKSTVLDAITFALYGRVKRAERGTQGIINTNMEAVRVSFTFELLKSGGRKIYRVERTYQRKKGSNNSCEAKIARLIEIAGDEELPVCDKASEVSSSIEELIGLSHDDFTRAVVLPQNSFQEFLMLDSAKKRDMLERIFYLDEYGKNLWDKLNRKTSGLKSQMDILTGTLTGYADATREAVDEARNSFETASEERARVEKELRLIEAKFNESREIWQLAGELELIEDREKQQMLHQGEAAEKRRLLESAIKADSMADIIKKNKEISVKLEETESRLKELLEVLPAITENLLAARGRYEAVKNEALLERPKLIEKRARFTEALAIKSQLAVIQNELMDLQALALKLKNDISHKNNSLRQEESELENRKGKLAELQQQAETLKTPADYRKKLQEGSKLELEVESAVRNIEEYQRRAEELKDAVSKLELKTEMLKEQLAKTQNRSEELEEGIKKHEALKTEESASIQKDRDELNRLTPVSHVLLFRKNEINDLNSKLDVQLSKRNNFEQSTDELNERRILALDFLEKCREAFEEASTEMGGNAAHMLSLNLVEGEPCPVCGSKNHPAPASRGNEKELSLLEQQVKAAKEKLADAEQALKETDNAILTVEEQIRSVEEQIESLKKELERKISEFDDQRNVLPEKLRCLVPEKLQAELERLEADSAVRLEKLEAWERKREEYTADLQELKNRLAEDRLSENSVYTELKVSHANYGQMEKTLSEMKDSLAHKQQCYLEFLQLHQIESAVSELSKITDNDYKMDLLQKEAEETRESLSIKSAQLEKEKEELRILAMNEIKLEADINSLTGRKSEKEAKLAEMAGDADIEAEIHSISQRLEDFTAMEKQYQEEVNSLEKQHTLLDTRKSTLENQHDIYTNEKHDEEARLNSALQEKGFQDMAEVEQSILPKEAQVKLAEEINEAERIWTNIQAQKGIVLKRLNARSITEEEWNSVNSTFQQLAALKEECVASSEVLKSNLNLIKSKHEKWVELNAKYTELTRKYSLLDTIGRLLRADRGKDNSFIDYIAEERLAYVAAKASEILGSITGYKYALELDTESGFIIRDNANGGVHRMVSSLSGGETFLTSLSLALALSEQIQLKGQSPLEFFFLDEGFGTLDIGLLDTVIDSLERLSSKERVIGLISHVPELKGRMARRLVVDPPSIQGDGSRVRIEKA